MKKIYLLIAVLLLLLNFGAKKTLAQNISADAVIDSSFYQRMEMQSLSIFYR